MVYSVKSAIDMKKQLREAGEKIVLVDFFATWCGPCKAIEPFLGQIERKYGQHLMIIKVNIDKLAEIADEYNVSCVPTFVFYKNGRKVRGNIAGADEEKLKKKLSALM